MKRHEAAERILTAIRKVRPGLAGQNDQSRYGVAASGEFHSCAISSVVKR